MPVNSAAATSRGLGRSSRRGAVVVARRYHFHGPGLAYAATLVVIMLGAINGQNNVLFWLFGLGVAGLLVSGVLSGAALMGLELERDVPATGVRRESLAIRYRLRNRSWLIPAFALSIEELPASIKRRPGGTWRGTADRITAFAANIPVRGEGIAHANLSPNRRGRYTFGAVRVSTTFPFGLAKKSVTFWMHGEVLVLPRAVPVAEPALEGLSRVGRSEGTTRRSRGGEEFFALREYVTGDPLRLIAARASARQDRTIVRDLAESGAGRITIIADIPDASANSERTVDAAAGLVKAAISRGLHVGVRSADGAFSVPPRGGARQLQRCLEVLALATPAALTTGRLGPGLTVIVSDNTGMASCSGIMHVSPGALGLPAELPPEKPVTEGWLASIKSLVRRWS